MPDSNSFTKFISKAPIVVYTSGSTYSPNGGSAIAANTTAAEESITFTGLQTTDTEFGISWRDSFVIPKGLQLVSCYISAANTLKVQWRNTTNASITPPAAASIYCAVFGDFFS